MSTATAATTPKSCVLTRDSFREHAKPVEVTIGGRAYTAEVKEFSTKSLGWNINGKVTIEVNGRMVNCQIGMNLTIIGSKDLPE